MTAHTAPATRRPLPARPRWVIGLLAFAAACYAVFGWLYDREIYDAAGSRLIFYFGWQDGEFAALAFVLGGLAVGTVLVLLIGPSVERIRNTTVFVIVQLVLFAVGLVLFLIWAVACLLIMMGAGMGAMDPVTAPDGQRELVERSVDDGEVDALWVPRSKFVYAQVPLRQVPTDRLVKAEECTLDTGTKPWVVTCHGIHMAVEGTG